MLKTASAFLVIFYSIGVLVFPLGDFSVLKDLPQIYKHCKFHEDKDMSPVDFITDHLINIDYIFDKHSKGDEQKPNTPTRPFHAQAQILLIINKCEIVFKKAILCRIQILVYFEQIYSTNFKPEIFGPPIFA
ncbi:MAG: hypothetical protein WCK02_14185 [Bacteroidota bacterium]